MLSYDQNFLDMFRRFKWFSKNWKISQMSYSKGWDDCANWIKEEYGLDTTDACGYISPDDPCYDPKHYKI